MAPASAPPEVQAVIAAGNEIATKPYKYGGGHGRWNDTGYDCSGSVSYALHGGDLISRAHDSGEFMRYGKSGRGAWITIYANSRPRLHGRRRPALRHERPQAGHLPLDRRLALLERLHGAAPDQLLSAGRVAAHAAADGAGGSTRGHRTARIPRASAAYDRARGVDP